MRDIGSQQQGFSRLALVRLRVIVCVCNALRERQVRDAARASGSACAHTAYAQLGCKVKCGMCLPFARDVVRAELANA
jgi:bacterioferritin-associated ferredoxin